MPNSLNGRTEDYYNLESEVIQFPEVRSSDNDWSYSTKELLDSLPKVWTRGLLYFLVIFITIALPWAMFSKIDETGKAQGQLEPKGKTIRLDAPVSGTVATIKVKEGEKVKVGQTLVELESDLVNADLQLQKNKLEGQENRLHQLDILKNQLQIVLQTQTQQNQAQKLEKLAQVNQAKQELEVLQNTYHLQQQEKLAQVNQAKQDLQHSQVDNHLAGIGLKTAEHEAQRYREAAEEGIVSQIQIVEKEDVIQERTRVYEQTKSDIEQAKLRLSEQQSIYERTIKQTKSDIEKSKLRLKEQENSYNSLIQSGEIAILKVKEQLKNVETDVTSLKSEIKQTKSQIQSLEFQLSQRVIKSPVEGTIFDLAVEREKSVLQSGNKIIEIAPQGTKLVLRAEMATQESGFLEKGMLVKMKFDAYPFQDYGIIEGKLSQVSPTTKKIETSDGETSAYELEIELDQTCIPSSKECIPLRPGDTATAEVVVRQRRLIDFILDPFKKLNSGGLEL
ncbi:secretion protein HlyD family protein [Gloeothece citriformis PCC 7424]|uniref:Secretion protein HlyD family protein n=1 Tax=Gloeothece citriformis (strain PCC 7424) TaxID=65393 RepID=B7KC54_GLOC7|nr:HlyD family efflux transporter periplasmic adaptor subunit [Gloeothece citriformis]ACK68877.1 secretion protein HlyD family protein [Gloeothece citriformis PCC 7424]